MNKPFFSRIAHPAQLLVFFFFALLGTDLSAQSAAISVQGVLTKTDGTAVDDGAYPITFRLWTAESGGTSVHEETIQQVETTGGVYSVLLGQNGFNGAATFSQVYYLGVSVNGGAELTPRPRLTHAPYTISVIGQNNKFTSTGPVEADGYKANGGVPGPGVAGIGYSFRGSGDQDGGLFSYQDNQVSLYTNAVEQLKIANGLTEIFTPATNTNNLFTYGYSHSNQGFYYHSNGTGQLTGMGLGNGIVSISANNQERVAYWNDGNNYYKAPSGTHIFQTGNVQIDNALNVSGNIGSNNDRVRFGKPIEVLGGNNIIYPLGPPVTGYGSGGILNSFTNNNIAAAFQGDIVANVFFAVSDKRIKKDFTSVNTAESLAKLQKLQVTDYRYIDELAQGKGLKKGFIAQEVEQIEPEAISTRPDFIPSIYAAAERVEVSGGLVMLKMAKPHGLQKGERVRLFDSMNQRQDLQVLSAGETTFTVAKWGDNAANGAFIFGKEVSDFHVVDYDHIFTMNVAATQEIARQVEILKAENASLRAQLESQSAAIGELVNRMNLLENAGATGMRK
ncbi:MAG: tail fiber domain-containing protein [Lewinellaceae bacterium]|nr:tail fiber domain-containing protein [Lewinellaceae bacterium]